MHFPSQQSQQVQFVNGEGHSAKDRYDNDRDHVAFGDLNGDGVDDAVITISENEVGSGSFVYLVAVLNDNGSPKAAAAVELGDRRIVKRIAVTGGNITAEYLAHGSNDAMCCPTKRVHRTWALQDDRLAVIR